MFVLTLVSVLCFYLINKSAAKPKFYTTETEGRDGGKTSLTQTRKKVPQTEFGDNFLTSIFVEHCSNFSKA